MRKSILILFFLIISLPYAISAPAPDGIAINPETRQCTRFWPGDEFHSYQLPEGWRFYSGGSHFSINTSKGQCVIPMSQSRTLDFISSISDCCQELGMEYIPNPTINTKEYYFGNNDHPTDYRILIFKNNTYYSCSNTNLGIAISTQENRCYPTYRTSPNYPNHTYHYIESTEKKQDALAFTKDVEIAYDLFVCNDQLPPSLQSTFFPDSYNPDRKIVTEFGTCESNDYDYEKCCQQLGLDYVKEPIGNEKTTSIGYQMIFLTLAPLIFFLLVIGAILTIAKIKTKSFVPIAKKYHNKGLIVGLLVGLLLVAGIMLRNEYIATIAYVVLIPIIPLMNLLQTMSEPPFLFIALIYCGLLGLLIGFIIGK